MKDRDDENNNVEQDGAAAESGNPWHRRESLFSDFDAEDEFEEPDRDSDFDAIYTEVEEEEAELEPAPEEADPWELAPAEDEEESDAAADAPWEDSPAEKSEAGEEEINDEPDLWGIDINPQGSFDDEPPEEEVDPLPLTRQAFTAGEDQAQEWDDLDEEEEFEEEEERSSNISPAMIGVVIFALILLAAGGYGVIEERAGLQDEIRQLRASLATSAPPAEVAAAREAAAQANERNTELLYQVDDLGRKNRSLQGIITGLESQLAAQKEAMETAAAAKAPADSKDKPMPRPAPAPEPAPQVSDKPTPKPAVEPAPTPAPAGNWFVNFSSYSQRATAENWAKKVKPGKGQVVVASAESGGKTIYRVRVIGLPDKASAQAVARDLQQQFNTGKLWIGRAD